MYRDFYQLQEKPFNVTSDPAFLYLTRKHQEALTFLNFGINERKGFLEITGEIGTGKTTLCRALLNQVNSQIKTALILNSDISSGLQLLLNITDDLGIQLEKRTKLYAHKALNKFLIDQLTQGNNVALIIDEAQNLKKSVLEQIRMLSNLETEKEKLLQIVLVGQPELRDKLNSPKLKQLRQRIAVRFHMTPLDKDELSSYICHRLTVAGMNQHNKINFTPEALDEIYDYSQGVPRLINVVCDKCLLLGFSKETRAITDSMVRESISEIENIPLQ